MNDPLVTVIICVYNGEDFLAEAIQCVIEQDYPATELIVVDDGSTDSSAEIANSYPQATLISHPENLGLPSARNTGIQAAAGEYIAFLDSDDLWPANKVSTQLEFLQKNPEYKFGFTQEKFFFEDMQERPNWTQKPAFQDVHVAYCAGSMLFHRSVFETVGRFNPEFRNGDTTEWVFRAKDKGFRGGVVEEVLLFRRIHEQNLSTKVHEEQKSLLKAVKTSIDHQKRFNE
jgi:glycosyltransferase involved in cell wall biosynthesis